jgi:uncharacterized protein YqhQ
MDRGLFSIKTPLKGTESSMAEKPHPEDIVGGQAVIEGVMMRHGDRIAVAVRTPDKDIETREQIYVSRTRRYPFLALRFIRGFVILLEMMVIGVKTLLYSADVAMKYEEKKPPKWHTVVSLLTGIAMAIFLFIVIPAYLFSILRAYVGSTILLNVIEGCIRLSIFLGFLASTLLMSDMRRVYMYHGAEHKTVFTWENGQELTVENIKAFSTRHPRCGTSFMMVVIVISILVFSLLGRPDFLERVFYKLMLLPVVAGISYEIIRLTGKYRERPWAAFLSWPGLILQKITTREPTDDQIEVAIAALKKVV